MWEYSGLAVITVAVASVAACFTRQQLRLRRVFLRRKPVVSRVLYDRYFAGTDVTFDEFAVVWTEVSHALRLREDQIRPSDRISRLPGAPPSWMGGGWDIQQYITSIDGTYWDAGRMLTLSDVVRFAVGKKRRRTGNDSNAGL